MSHGWMSGPSGRAEFVRYHLHKLTKTVNLDLQLQNRSNKFTNKLTLGDVGIICKTVRS